jgi:hypothetical protein
MAPELAAIAQMKIEVGYLAACFADYADPNPRANEKVNDK